MNSKWVAFGEKTNVAFACSLGKIIGTRNVEFSFRACPAFSAPGSRLRKYFESPQLCKWPAAVFCCPRTRNTGRASCCLYSCEIVGALAPYSSLNLRDFTSRVIHGSWRLRARRGARAGDRGGEPCSKDSSNV
jgi:hypothetical protein